MHDHPPVLQHLAGGNYHIDVLRLDLLHPEVSGNKWFKLRHNLAEAKTRNLNRIVTFGGAFSNHIAATAAACQLLGLQAIGIIRGEEQAPLNPTLQKAKAQGMQLHFVSRSDYAQKDTEGFERRLTQQFGPHYLIPEGGNNVAGLTGCMEILKPGFDHDYIVCACGTGTTYAGILAASQASQKVIGISVLKGENTLPQAAGKLLQAAFPGSAQSISGNEALEKELITQSCLVNAYCFNGYARFHGQLNAFKNGFEERYTIPLDHVYTAKLFYALFDLAEKNKFRAGSRILAIHSGGLQGNKGFEALHPQAAGMFSQA